MRLDAWIAQNHDLTRSIARELIEEGKVSIEGKIIKKASTVIESSARVTIDMPGSFEKPLEPEKRYIEFLYEDQDIIVLNKPCHLTVHPAGEKTGTLVNALLYYPKTLSALAGAQRPGIVHRLDKDTEGLMVVAKSDHAYLHLKEQFQTRSVQKKYYAWVHGEPKQDDFLIDHPISRHPSKHNHMTSHNSEEAKEALTEIKVIKRMSSSALCIAKPITGRTHQIRVHLATVGHPVIGDPLYTSKKQKKTYQKLQAFYLSFQHPTKPFRMTFELPLSKSMQS
jgi:23S rRNA pseudouridine1911/1915/1917 synthase